MCGKNPKDPSAKEVCQTTMEAHLETGQFVLAVGLIEAEQKKILELILPTRLLLPAGTRTYVDANPNPASEGVFVICEPQYCMSQHEVTEDFVSKLKAGKTLLIQAINGNRQPISFLMPLAEFAKVHDGPPTDPKVLEEQQKEARKKMEEELRKRGEETQKKMPPPPAK
jgi:invasion protein IalB